MKIRVLFLLLMLSVSIMTIIPVHAITVPNAFEGDWTTYTEIFEKSGGSVCPNGNLATVKIDSAGTALALATLACSITASGQMTSIPNGGGATFDTLGSDVSIFGTYAVGFTTAKILLFKSGALFETLVPDTNLGTIGITAISPDGQWIIAMGGPNNNIELWQGTGTGPTVGPSYSDLDNGGSFCGGPDCGGPTTSVTSQGTTINYIGPITSPLLNATQGVTNPANYTLPVLIILIVVGITVYLGVTQKKEGAREPGSVKAQWR